MQVQVTQGSITNLSVDAIVNPTNSHGTMEAGVGALIREQGGEEIEAEAKSAAPIAIGAALITKAGSLPAKHVLHTPITKEPDSQPTTEDIRRAARAALIAASARKIASIAMPCMGLESLELGEAIRSVLEELKGHKKDFPETVILVDPSEDVTAALEEALGSMP
jgi:O-acetyl-ADP-ribose deacetylase (regulator of RNase III)